MNSEDRLRPGIIELEHRVHGRFIAAYLLEAEVEVETFEWKLSSDLSQYLSFVVSYLSFLQLCEAVKCILADGR